MIWRDSTGSRRRRALTIFAAQLALNALWSFLFFGLRSPGLGAIEIVLLWGAIVATILVFSRISRIAASLLVPYLAWVTYAAALNLKIWNLNG
jgi:tryptophan-rich sensory protein